MLHIRTSTDHNLEFEETGGDLRISALNNARSANVELEFAASEFSFLTGKVGIGTDAPSDKLEVSGTGGTRLKVTNTDTDWAGLDLQSGGNQSNYIFFRDDSAERARIQVTDGNDIKFSTTSSVTARMTILSNGDIQQFPSTGSGSVTNKVLPRVVPNYPSAGTGGSMEDWYTPVRGESGRIDYAAVNATGGEYRCAGFIVYSASESNNTPVAISIAVTESINAHMLAFDTNSGKIRIQNTYGYSIEVVGYVTAFLR